MTQASTHQMALDVLLQLQSVSSDCGFSVRYDTKKAIAALEAEIAAPQEPAVNAELLAALQAILAGPDGKTGSEFSQVITNGYAAIAKAEGGAS